MTYIGTPPTEFVIPITKGADREFTLRRKDTDGNPVNWDADVWIAVDIDKTAPTLIDADVTDDEAIIKLESAVTDKTKNGMRWRVIMSTGTGDTSTETAIAVGTFERHDG